MNLGNVTSLLSSGVQFLGAVLLVMGLVPKGIPHRQGRHQGEGDQRRARGIRARRCRRGLLQGKGNKAGGEVRCQEICVGCPLRQGHRRCVQGGGALQRRVRRRVEGEEARRALREEIDAEAQPKGDQPENPIDPQPDEIAQDRRGRQKRRRRLH